LVEKWEGNFYDGQTDWLKAKKLAAAEATNKLKAIYMNQ